jgi:hypothetical protein
VIRGFTIAWIAIALLAGCATEWRAEKPVRPMTYDLPGYRAERSVGNLRRLAIMPAQMKRVGLWGLPVAAAPGESPLSGKGLSDGAAAYLAEQKGYETIPVEGDGGVWRPEILARPEHGSVEELKAVWDAARTDSEVEAAVRRIGRALDADGIVAMWAEYVAARRGDTATEVTVVILNFFLANAPFFYGMSHRYAEAVIHETASGRPVWRIQLSAGPEGGTSGAPPPVYAARFFENLENAIPAQLVR